MIFIFLVQLEDDDGNNLDLVVEAEDVPEAVIFWEMHFWPDQGEDFPKPDRVFKLTPTGQRGVVPWDLVADYRQEK